jgi:hypothetical protein
VAPPSLSVVHSQKPRQIPMQASHGLGSQCCAYKHTREAPYDIISHPQSKGPSLGVATDLAQTLVSGSCPRCPALYFHGSLFPPGFQWAANCEPICLPLSAASSRSKTFEAWGGAGWGGLYAENCSAKRNTESNVLC